MQEFEEGFKSFQHVMVICGPSTGTNLWGALNWYQITNTSMSLYKVKWSFLNDLI